MDGKLGASSENIYPGVAKIKIKHEASTYTQVAEQTWYALQTKTEGQKEAFMKGEWGQSW